MMFLKKIVMKKVYLLFVLLVVSQLTQAQVGIGTTAPNSQLDVHSSNQATPANTDGIIIPKVDTFPATNPTISQQGMLVYLTTATTFLATTRQSGFYYWNFPTLDWIGISSSINGDHDWYEEGTTTAPDAITDDMFHTGNVAIGKNTADYPLEVTTTTFDIGINNTFNNNSNNFLKASSNTISGSGNGTHAGIYNLISGTGTGIQTGVFNEITNSGSPSQSGMTNFLTTPNSSSKYGVSTILSGDGPLYGDYVSISNSANTQTGFNATISTPNSAYGFVYGVNNTIQNNGSGQSFGVKNSFTGTGNGILYGINNDISNTGTGDHFGTQNLLSGTGTGLQFGNYTSISNTGSGTHSGLEINLNGNGSGGQYGISSTITNSGNSNHYGFANRLNGSGLGDHYALYNVIGGTGTGTQYGNYTSIANTGNGLHYGANNILSGTGTGTKYGTRNELSGGGSQYGNFNILLGTGIGNQVGSYNEIVNSSGSQHYGVISTLSGIGAGSKTGIYSYINPAAGGTHYGIYSEVLKAGATNFAGYFLGNVGIGTTGANIYTLPASRGTNLQILQTNGTGVVSWQNLNTALNPTAWLTTGNSGTTPATNFLGTTDAQSIAFRTTNIERARITNAGYFVVNNTTPFTGDIFSSYASGSNFAINGYATGSGAAGYFANNGTGPSINAFQSGTLGTAGQFTISGVGINPSPVLDVYNQTGSSPAITVRTDLANAGADGIELDINGASAKRGIDMYMDTATTGIGMTIFHDGTSRCLNLQQQSATNINPTLFASTAGNARVINATSSLTTGTQITGFFNQGSTGIVTATYSNAASVWGQSSGIRSGVFVATGATANTTCLQGTYTGPAGNYDAIGVYGQSTPAAFYGYGVVGTGGWYGVFANGNLGASGTKAFEIDHPLDPENKYLKHYSMESPEVLNMYRGNIVLDANGEATVTLPDYFKEININFSYHLTPIGSFANLYIKEEIQGNQFKIAGGNPNQKISWQVFAERNDLYLQQNPESKAVEVDKKEFDKGLYLRPELYNQPEEKGIFNRNKANPSTVKSESEIKPNKQEKTEKTVQKEKV